MNNLVYSVPVRRRDRRLEFVECYAVKSLGDKCNLPDTDIYEDICSKVKVSMKKVAKPKRIYLLLSLKSSRLMSDKLIKTVEGVKLFSGPLGFCVAGNIEQFLPKQQKDDVQVSKIMMTRARPLPSKTFLNNKPSGEKGRYPEVSKFFKKVESGLPRARNGGRKGGRFAFTGGRELIFNSGQVGAKSRDSSMPGNRDSRKTVKVEAVHENEEIKDEETGIGGSEELSQPAQTGSDTRHMSATITAAMPSVQTHTSSIESEYSPQRDNNLGSSDIQESQLLASFQLESMNAFRVSCNISNRATRLKRRAEISSHRQPPA